MRGTRIALIGIAAALVGFGLAMWLFPARTPAPAPEAAAPAAPDAPAAAPVPDAAPGEFAIASGGRLELEAAALPPDRPVVLRLALGEGARSDAPHPVVVVSPDLRRLELEGALGPERRAARVEVDPGFLKTPGRYAIEVRTSEPTHFPIRRYVIEVR